MFGFNGRHSANPFGVKVSIQSVNNGTIYWKDTLGPYSHFTDASESCIDATGNIYMIADKADSSSIIKLRSDGTIIWKRDSLTAGKYYGFALSNDETRVYYKDMYHFTCRDSSGNKLWSINGWSDGSTPVIGKDGTIYVCFDDMLNAVSPDGSIKWQTLQISVPSSHPALDRDENIYILQYYNQDELIKFDKNGNLIWKKNLNLTIQLDFTSVVIDGFNNLYFQINDTLYSYDNNGNKRWQKCAKWGAQIPAITSDNGIISDSLNNIVKYDLNGNIIWSFLVQANLTILNSIILDDVNNSYLIVYLDYQSYIISADKDGNSRWNYNMSSFNWMGYPGIVISPNQFLFSSYSKPNVIFTIR